LNTLLKRSLAIVIVPIKARSQSPLAVRLARVRLGASLPSVRLALAALHS